MPLTSLILCCRENWLTPASEECGRANGGREATVGKITELATITAMLFGAWQWWPHQLVLLIVLPQLAFGVFVGGLIGCTFGWVFEQAVARN
jgi:hypothetical protein